MVVANPRVPKGGVVRAGSGPRVSALRGQPHHRLEDAADIVIRKREITVPSLLSLPQQSGGLQLSKMETRGLYGDASLRRKFAGGERLAAHKRGQHVGARRIPKQRSQQGDVRSLIHTSILIEASTAGNMQ